MNQVVNAFEEIALNTWKLLEKSHSLGMKISEETLTDLNLLDLADKKLKNIQIRKISKPEESKIGLDWELWVAHTSNRVFRYAIQAKKLDFSLRYTNLWHSVASSGALQIDLLDEFAEVNNAIPLYCFFNFTNEPLQGFWQCNDGFEAEQFGCTIAHSAQIKSLLGIKNSNKFESVHSLKPALPLRCLVKCPLFSPNRLSYASSYPFFGNMNGRSGFYDSVPWFFDGNSLEISDIDNYYSSELGIYPRFLILVDLRNVQ